MIADEHKGYGTRSSAAKFPAFFRTFFHPLIAFIVSAIAGTAHAQDLNLTRSGAASSPAIATAGTYRMIIQSHPDVGARCIDVPNAQFVRGMRVQMWDYNNTVAQIFSYDESKQQLTIGNLCVESWGGGDPQDGIGLEPCNGRANQRWNMVASNDYYQIIGINNRCLEVRYGNKYGVKDNGVPLDIMDCDASRAQRIWALLEPGR
jgi:hypothetical protein